MKSVILLLNLMIALAMVTCVYGQGHTIQIKIVVADSLSRKPLPDVTASVAQKGIDGPLSKQISDSNGIISFPIISEANYILSLKHLGYVSRSIEIKSSHLISNPILMMPEIQHLKEVEIQGQAGKIIKNEVDKIIYNVDADPEAASSMVLDILRKVPMVSIDANDNITLKGSDSYKVLLNGRESPLLARNAKDVFRIMPASSIKRIEVISNPPAKYDAEGIGGIINIITFTNTLNGYNATVNAGIADPEGYNSMGYLSLKRSKMTFSGNGGYIHYSLAPQFTDQFRENFNRGSNLRISSVLDATGNMYYGNGDLAFDFDTLNQCSVNLTISDNKAFSTYLQNTLSSVTNGGVVLKDYSRTNVGDFIWKSYSFGGDFQHTFSRNKKQTLTFSYKYYSNNNDNYQDYADSSAINGSMAFTKSYNLGSLIENTFQVNYTHPFRKNQFETGLKLINRDNMGRYAYLIQLSGKEFTVDSRRSNDFEYYQNVYSGYASFNLKNEQWSLKLGGRFELTMVNAQFKSTNTIAAPNYFNLIPSVLVSRKLDAYCNLKFSYTQRIERPSLSYLNPFIDEAEAGMVTFGNPGLNPALSNSFEIGFNSVKNSRTFIASLSYRFTDNAIQRVTSLKQDSVAQNTFENIGKNGYAGLNLYSSLPIIKPVNIYFNGSLNYVHFKSPIAGNMVKNEGVRGNMTANIIGSFPLNWRVGSTLSYNTGNIQLQGSNSGYLSNSVSFNKQFLKTKSLTLGCALSNPFNKYNHIINTVYDNGSFYQKLSSESRVRKLDIALIYKFGKLNSSRQESKKGIVNDDLKEEPKKISY